MKMKLQANKILRFAVLVVPVALTLEDTWACQSFETDLVAIPLIAREKRYHESSRLGGHKREMPGERISSIVWVKTNLSAGMDAHIHFGEGVG
jgi:hypothetical protein